MNIRFVCAVGAVASLLGLVAASAETSIGGSAVPVSPSPMRGQVMYATPAVLKNRAVSTARTRATQQATRPANPRDLVITTEYHEGNEGLLPLWTYRITAARDGLQYEGAIVGHSPFQSPGTNKVPAIIVPLVLHVHSIATNIDPNTGVVTSVPGEVTSDPSQADNLCMQAPNNTPVRVIRESPLFSPTQFVFGATNVGVSQYLDAHQRASFWNVSGQDESRYHLLLDPVRIAAPLELEVPPEQGVALTSEAVGSPVCGTFQLINSAWFDWYLQEAVIPTMEGLTPSVLPVFIVYSAGFAGSAQNLFTCCAVGYHSITGIFGAQTYAVADFDTSQLFGVSVLADVDVLSHEVAEWGNDPFTWNMTPSWGDVGQTVGFCQENLEVGDPLSGTDRPPIQMPNGYDYHLQELAFFSWFYGAPSIGANGWFSNGGSFRTDAGPVCVE